MLSTVVTTECVYTGEISGVVGKDSNCPDKSWPSKEVSTYTFLEDPDLLHVHSLHKKASVFTNSIQHLIFLLVVEKKKLEKEN